MEINIYLKMDVVIWQYCRNGNIFIIDILWRFKKRYYYFFIRISEINLFRVGILILFGIFLPVLYSYCR